MIDIVKVSILICRYFFFLCGIHFCPSSSIWWVISFLKGVCDIDEISG